MYTANNELAEILLKNGFIEITTKRDKIKGKKEFSLTKTSRKKIYFDYINIKVLESLHLRYDTYELTQSDLAIIILFFKLKYAELKELFANGIWNMNDIIERINYLKKEYEFLVKKNIHSKRQERLEYIFSIYEGLILK